MSAKDTNVGKNTERAVAGWLRANGWPGAERLVRTGFRTSYRESPDEGDITGCPGICWQVKSLRPTARAELAIPSWLAQTEQQRAASGATLGFLVVRRWGTTDVGRWWAFTPLGQLHHLTCTDEDPDVWRPESIPIRMEMAHLRALLHIAGWTGAEATA